MIRFLCCLSVLHVINSARILTFFNFPSLSHQNAFRPIWEALALRNHEVTVITPNPIESSSPNLKIVDVSVGYDVFEEVDLSRARRSEMTIYAMTRLFDYFGSKSLQMEMETEQFQRILKLEKNHFDLIIVEAHVASMYALQHKFNAPLIAISSMGVWGYTHYMFGNTIHPLMYPEADSGSTNRRKLSIWNKIDNAFVTLVRWLYYKLIHLPNHEKIAEKVFGNDLPPLETLMRKASLLFLNENPVFSDRRPNVPNVMQYYHINRSHSSLPEDLQRIMDDAKEGVVYFSLGTNVRLEHVNEKMKRDIIKVLGELPYTVLCKWDTEQMDGKPKNIILRKMFPQQAILAHPNLKLFVTQGGLQSSEEAILNGVPLVVIPFLGDQPLNAEILKSHGMAETIPIAELNKQILKQKILEVANNEKYRAKAMELREVLLDQPQSGIEKVVWWCEYVMRHKGAKHLRSPAADISLYEYFMVDVIVVCLVIIFSVYKITSFILKNIFRLVSRKNTKRLKDE